MTDSKINAAILHKLHVCVKGTDKIGIIKHQKENLMLLVVLQDERQTLARPDEVELVPIDRFSHLSFADLSAIRACPQGMSLDLRRLLEIEMQTRIDNIEKLFKR